MELYMYIYRKIDGIWKYFGALSQARPSVKNTEETVAASIPLKSITSRKYVDFAKSWDNNRQSTLIFSKRLCPYAMDAMDKKMCTGMFYKSRSDVYQKRKSRSLFPVKTPIGYHNDEIRLSPQFSRVFICLLLSLSLYMCIFPYQFMSY